MIKSFFLIIICFLVSWGAFSQTLEIPVITNVSVDQTSQQAVISWSISDPANIDGYIIKRQIFGQPGVVDGSYNTIETITDRNQFSYLDISMAYGPSLPGSGVETYRVASYKDIGGGNIIFSNMSEPVSTIYLMPVDFDLCLEQNSIAWTAFNGFGADLTGYNIYYINTLGGTPVLVGHNENDDTTFIHVQPSPNTQFYYFIEAESNQGVLNSYSNRQSVFTTMPNTPQIMNADYATVETNGQVELSFTVDAAAQVNGYLLVKSDSINGTYDSIAIFQGGNSTITYSDPLETSQDVAYYKLISINTCGLRSRESNVANNIVLDVKQDEKKTYINNLSWNKYEDWLGQANTCIVYRSIDDGPFTEIASFWAGITSYKDDISEFMKPEIAGRPTKGKFCYYVELSEGTGNPYGIMGRSKSNSTCVQQEAIVYLPNAFNPNSAFEENRTFKPVATFVNDYQLIIYNRWGDIIFQTTSSGQGWDGRDKSGNLSNKGTYVFYLKYQGLDNTIIEKSGQINLVY